MKMYVHDSHGTLGTLLKLGFVLMIMSIISIIALRQETLHSPTPIPTTTAVQASTDVPPLVLYHDRNGVLMACSIPNSCMRVHTEIRELYVPEAYRVHDSILRRCRSFVETPSYPTSFDPVLHYYKANSSNPVIRDSLANQEQADVLGAPFNSQYHQHFAHFVADFIDFAIMPANLFINNPNFSALPKPLCVFPHLAKSKLCNRSQLPQNPRFVVANKRLHSWTSHLLMKVANVNNNKSLHLAPYTPWTVATCFRSIITSPIRFDTRYPARDRLLRSAGVKRTTSPNNVPHIVVLSRVGNGSRSTPLNLVNELKTELRNQLDSNKLSDTTVEFVHSLSALGFEGQVALMQRATILVSTHGAELSNVLFLRQGSTVIEIFPFGWVFRQFFERLLKAVRAHRIELYSRPDPERFYRCMRERKRPKKEILLYNRQLEQYSEALSNRQRIQASLFKVPSPLHMGACVRYQRTTFSPKVLAQVIVQQVLKRHPTKKYWHRFFGFF